MKRHFNAIEISQNQQFLCNGVMVLFWDISMMGSRGIGVLG
jgi:hypothetical protein